jgi:hypothetical protein
LDEAVTHLDALGIRHEPVNDIGQSYILEFRDPDDMALELTAPKSRTRSARAVVMARRWRTDTRARAEPKTMVDWTRQ